MGAKAKHPTGARQSKRPAALTAEDVAAPSTKVRARAERVTTKKRVGKKKRRLYPESVPPGMVAEVFDVSGADENDLQPSIPPPPGVMHDAAPRFLSKPPAPPRPSLPPTEEDDTLELDEEELEPDSEALAASDPRRTPLLTPEPMLAPVAPRRSGAGAWLAIGVAALVLGLVLGDRMRAEHPAPTPGRGVEPLAHTEAMPRPTELAAAVAASAAPEVTLDIDALPKAEPATNPQGPTTSATSAFPAAPVANEDLGPFDTKAASAALTAAFARASSCRGPDDPTGEVTATLTYAPSGRVTTATVSGVFAGTPIGGCVAAAMRGARVPPFSGEHLTVRRTTLLK